MRLATLENSQPTLSPSKQYRQAYKLFDLGFITVEEFKKKISSIQSKKY